MTATISKQMAAATRASSRRGDGVVHAEVEACDDGNDSDADACLGDCTLNVCGDGILNVDAEAATTVM